MEPRRLELDEPFLSASKLPANVGGGNAVVLRTTHSTTLCDHVGQLRREVDDLRARLRLNDPTLVESGARALSHRAVLGRAAASRHLSPAKQRR